MRPVESFAIPRHAARTPTLPPATHTNSYALGEREVLLVEPATPYEDERRLWIEWARGFTSRGQRLVALLLTHHHADHVGGAEFFADALGLPIWAHAETAARLPQLAIARLLADGDVLELAGPTPQRWDVLHTPGHAPGHVCLFEAALGAVVVGDMVASEGTILIAPGDGDMARYLVELRRLEALGARVALPAHGGPIEQPSASFAHYVRHRLMREAKILGAIRALGAAGVDELLALSYDDVPREIWPLARLSQQAHLDKLLAEGQVERDDDRYREYPSR